MRGPFDYIWKEGRAMPDVGNFGTLVSLVVLGVTYIIIQPLKQSIATLTRSVDRLADTADDTKRVVNDLRERIAKVESSSASAHKRIDYLEGKHNG